jgi:hypothetical protein
MEDVLTHITDSNVVIEAITSQIIYLVLKSAKRIVVEKKTNQPKTENLKSESIIYNKQREKSIDRTIENSKGKDSITKFVKEPLVILRATKR